MIPVKRLEIVVDAPHGDDVTDLLTRHGLTGWTVVRGAAGAGERGRQLGDEITGVSSNHLIVTTCPQESLDALIEDLRTLLVRFGGMCLVSDALWLRH
jgi:PII-like signaling protein